MKLSRLLALAPSALGLAAAAFAQPKQEVKPPQAQAWIDVATFSGMGMPMGGPAGGSPMGALGGLFGAGGANKVSFLMTQSGPGGSYVDVTLMTRRNPQLAEAMQNVAAIAARSQNDIAFGHELNLIHPPRPSDPKVAWEPEWAVKVRVKAVASAIVGMPAMEAMRPADTREAKDSEPASEKRDDAKKPSALDILRGVIGR